MSRPLHETDTGIYYGLSSPQCWSCPSSPSHSQQHDITLSPPAHLPARPFFTPQRTSRRTTLPLHAMDTKRLSVSPHADGDKPSFTLYETIKHFIITCIFIIVCIVLYTRLSSLPHNVDALLPSPPSSLLSSSQALAHNLAQSVEQIDEAEPDNEGIKSYHQLYKLPLGSMVSSSDKEKAAARAAAREMKLSKIKSKKIAAQK